MASKGFKGTHFIEGSRRWTSQITYETIVYYLGTFDSRKRASQAYDWAASLLYGHEQKCNYPHDPLRPEMPPDTLSHPKMHIHRNHRNNTASQYMGVSIHTSGKYEAKITHQYTRHYLGHYATAIEAARAYDRKAAELFGENATLNFPNTQNASGAD